MAYIVLQKWVNSWFGIAGLKIGLVLRRNPPENWVILI